MNIYVDNHASTLCDPRVLTAILPYFGEKSAGNPSSTYHKSGVIANEACQQSRAAIAELVGCKNGRVIFTGSATEANNLALIGSCIAARDSRGANHIISTLIEHPSVLRSLEYLEKCGFIVSRVQPNHFGQISAAEVLSLVRDDTALISVMSANNEVGTLQPIGEIAANCPSHVLVHCDA